VDTRQPYASSKHSRCFRFGEGAEGYLLKSPPPYPTLPTNLRQLLLRHPYTMKPTRTSRKRIKIPVV
ncbi:MAG: hypothetical protein K2K23_04375, partial [Muribaculaceae bacterium]|nr:hypothetical protein [Muribaculaceae bacterium]